MENPIPQDRVTDRWNGLKQALIAVLIGSAITIIGDIAQVAINWLQNYPVEVAGPITGMVRYLVKWTSSQNV